MEPTTLSQLPLDVLQDQIATVSATLQAATHRLLLLIAELDRRGGWSEGLDQDGFRSCAHWLSFRVGLDLVTARQYVRVARALPGFPKLAAAFGRGELSYSKVRALVRIARPETEEDLLAFGLAGTATQVEQLVRRYRRAHRHKEQEHAEAQRTGRGLVTFWDDDGMLVVQGRLTPEQGALLQKALERAGDELHPRRHDSAESSQAPGPALVPTAEVNGSQLLADALARVAEQALEHGSAAASAGDRYLVTVHVDAEVLADPEADGRCEVEDGPALAADTARRLACDAAVCEVRHGPDGEVEAGRRTRVVSAALRRALRARDGTRCGFPGCGCRARQIHHVRHWANGGATVLGNVVGLCSRCHHRVHEGGYAVKVAPDGVLRCYRPDGTEVRPAPPRPAVREAPVRALLEAWVMPGVKLGPETGRPTGAGERPDYEWMGCCLDSLVKQE